MTQKEYSIIAAINQEGIDNSMWGMSNVEQDTDAYGCTIDNKLETLPPHIYIYGDPEYAYSKEMHELLYAKYDRKYVNPYDDTFICFFWLGN